jgi:hypothetical protein
MSDLQNILAPTRQRSRRPNVIASENRVGRIRRAVRRAFVAGDGNLITARDVLQRAFPRIQRAQDWHRWSVRRALLQEAICVARNRFGRGRPNLWAPNKHLGAKSGAVR